MRTVFIVLVLMVTVGAGGYFGYNAAYAMGETAGYDIGYPAGEEAGYNSGKQTGYKEGYTSGELDGYNEGYDGGYSAGRAAGYDEGYSSGKTEGYSSGYDEGMEAGVGHGYTLRDPTYAEVIAFLREDRTDENEYDENTYDCANFTRDVSSYAEQKGFRSAAVIIDFPDRGHIIIAFNTIDEGQVYFEPQSDERVKPVIGKRYYQSVILAGDYYYEAPPYDDTVIGFVVIW